MQKLIGPFKQVLTMNNLPSKGAISDDMLEIIEQGGIVVENDKIIEIGDFQQLNEKYEGRTEIELIEREMVALPGFIDCHTHICWAGSRSGDYAKRLSGKSYLEIAKEGGGIDSTVKQTRQASVEKLSALTTERANTMLQNGVTTIEVKSGYGLNIPDELKMLNAIKEADTLADLIPTCLAAHIKPKDFNGTQQEDLDLIVNELLLEVQKNKLASRVDIFVEEGAFDVDNARKYLQKAKALGFDLLVHGDQFNTGGSALSVELQALSVDHLESSKEYEIEQLAKSDVVATVLPGASLGLGIPFAAARKMLDSGVCVAIASDWNPGSAPNGDLLMQASVLGAYERLSMAETLAAITERAAKALKLKDRGILKEGNIADIVAFSANDFSEILYRQGALKPVRVWKKGKPLLSSQQRRE